MLALILMLNTNQMNEAKKKNYSLKINKELIVKDGTFLFLCSTFNYRCLANLKTTQNPEMYLNEYKVAGCI